MIISKPLIVLISIVMMLTSLICVFFKGHHQFYNTFGVNKLIKNDSTLGITSQQQIPIVDQCECISYNDSFIQVNVRINLVKCHGLILLTTEYGMIQRFDHDDCVNVISERNMNCTVKDYNKLTRRFTSMYCSKFIKTHPYMFGDKILWIDTHYTKHDLNSLVEKFSNYNSSRFFSHWFNNNIDQEVISARGQERYVISGVNEQIMLYKARFESPPYLFAMGFFLFIKDPCTIRLFNVWWYHNIFYSFEDQISFPVLLYNMRCNFEIDRDQPCYYITGSRTQNCLNGKSSFLDNM